MVINVSSGAAYEGQIGQSAYAATKAGIIGMNMPAARELGSIGVRVNAIAPGLFLTAMVASLDEKVLSVLKEPDGSAEASGRHARVCALLRLHHRKRLRQWRNHSPRCRVTDAGEIKSGCAFWLLSSSALLEITNEIG